MSGIFDRYIDKWNTSTKQRRMSSSRLVNTRSDVGFILGRSSSVSSSESSGPDIMSDAMKDVQGMDTHTATTLTAAIVAPNVRTQDSWGKGKAAMGTKAKKKEKGANGNDT